MIDIIDILGVSALPSRMKRISNKILIDADKLYEAYGFDFKASWYPIYRLVLSEKKMSITEIAQTLQVKHPSIVYLIKQMLAAGIISQSQGKKDKRYHLIHITKKGENLSNELQEFWDDHRKVLENIQIINNQNLYKLLVEFEKEIDKESIYERVMKIKKTN